MNNMSANEVDISVIMATYNPSWDKCRFTLDSIIEQRNVNFELVITDDGSSENLFDRIDEYLKSKGFSNYRLVGNKTNQGTVKNYYSGILNANGKYLKLISPGDALFNETTLERWMNYLSESGKTWSFGNSVFISGGDKNEVVEVPALPRIIDCYTHMKEDTCRWNYVVLEDVALGAAILCERQIFAKYLEMFVGTVLYAEDVAFSAMMFYGYLPAYYDDTVMFYEYGSGVSTGEKKWLDRIHNDWRMAERIIVSAEDCDELQAKMKKALLAVNSGSDTKKKIRRNLQKGGIKKVIKHRLSPRMTVVDVSSCGKWWNNKGKN